MSGVLCPEDKILPPDDFDFNVVTVTKKKIYILANGKPAKYIDIVGSDAFVTPSNSDETEVSSDESISSKASSKTTPVSSISSEKTKFKEEIVLSDSSSKSKEKQKKLHKRSSPTRLKYSVVEYSDSSDEEDDYRHRVKKESKKKQDHKPIKYEEPEEVDVKPNPNMTAAFGDFHCHVCDIVVNSEVTFQTHILGKKHLKMEKSKAVPEIAIQSLNEPQLPSEPRASISRQNLRQQLNVDSLIQRVAENYRDGPLPCLSEVVELRPTVAGVKDIAYFCKLCDAQCQPNTIMRHLTGFRHYLHCLEIIDPRKYEEYRFSTKKTIEDRVRKILWDHERRYGRGKICVEIDRDIPPSDINRPGCSSWRDNREDVQQPLNPPILDNADGNEKLTDTDYLDTRMNDYRCKACDAHMNNTAMWEAHVRGKRHIKNKKKVPGETTSKIKAVQCPNETAHLMQLLDKNDDGSVIVGLDYIKETQGENGDLYNCFLCGSCSSPFDIRDHLLSIKHMTKYLEAMNLKGCSNAIDNIKALYGISKTYKDNLILAECVESEKEYGPGKVVVYRSKNMF